jgi:methylmalonyl-CoA carboxyltransferase 5S subunit
LRLRDAHQSLMATRMAMEDMVDACADIDKAGFWSVECWGGATYDACIRFLNEDPWQRLRTFRELMPNSRLQMLLRGQNLLGYRHYEDHVVDKFVEKSAENGMDVFRVFDALNDPRNMARAMAAVKKTGKHAQGTICYTISPLHTTEGYIKLAGQLLDMGAESIALKDMAALLQPQPAYDIVKGIKDTYGDVQINVHCHSTTGVTLVSLMKAIEAGADVVDTAISSMSLGPGHNPTESLVAMLEGTEYTTASTWTACSRSATTSRRSAQVRRVRVGHPGRHRHLLQPDPRRHALQHGEPAQGPGRGRPHREVMEEVPLVKADAGTRRWSRRPVADRRHPGRVQRPHGQVQGADRRVRRPDARLLRRVHRRAQPEVVEIAQARPRRSRSRCARPTCSSPSGTSWSRGVRARRLRRHRRGRADLRHVPGRRARLLRHRAEGPKNVGKTEQMAKAAESAKDAAGAVKGPISYTVSLGGREHSVTVERA